MTGNALLSSASATATVDTNDGYSLAGATNTNTRVYEVIAGLEIRAVAIAGSENLTMKLSHADAWQHWHWVDHGVMISWRPEYSHLLRGGMFTYIKEDGTDDMHLFTVKFGTTVAQRLISPRESAQVAYAKAAFV